MEMDVWMLNFLFLNDSENQVSFSFHFMVLCFVSLSYKIPINNLWSVIGKKSLTVKGEACGF